MDGFEAEPSQEEAVFDSAAFDTAVDGGLEELVAEQVAETNKAASPKVGMAARNARIRKTSSRLSIKKKASECGISSSAQ